MPRFPLLLALLLVSASAGGCRLIAGIHDIELEDAGPPKEGGGDVGRDGTKDAASDGHADAVTDGSDTGPCSCAGCNILASNQDLPLTIQLVGDTLYWVNFGSAGGRGSIMSLPTTGGKPTEVVSGLTQAYGLQVDATNLYWGSLDNMGKGLIEQRPITGGAVVTLVSDLTPPMGLISQGVAQLPSTQFLAVSSTTVYFVTFGPTGAQSIVDSVPIGGGSEMPFLTHLAGEGDISVVEAYALSVFGSSLYVISSNKDVTEIVSVPLSGGPSKSVVSDLTFPLALAVTSTDVVWCDDESDFTNGFVTVAAIDGSSTKTLGSGLPAPWAVITDSGYAYWANSGNACLDGSIQKALLDGSGGTVSVVPDALAPESLVVDDKFVYWVDNQCGGIIKHLK
jgi:hypothetical protein